VRVDDAKRAQALAQGRVVYVVLARHEHLPGAFPDHLVDGPELARAGFVRGLQVLTLGRDVPELQVRVVADHGPRERVLIRVIKDQQPQPPGKPQAASLPLAERVPEEPGRFYAGWLKRDHARDREEITRVVLACEAFKAARQEQRRQDIVRWFGHRGDGPVVSHTGAC
jgi:hypothetical protein